MDQLARDLATFRTWVEECPPGKMVFFGGAGVSTESGIPDFRGTGGLYSQKYGDISPEAMVSRSFFDANPEMFYQFYFDRMLCLDIQPNQAHLKLAELEREGTLRAVITQNVDGLHQKAGSKTVWELHGSQLTNHCMDCGARYDLEKLVKLHDQSPTGVPKCPECGGIVKPDVVLFEEGLDMRVLEGAVDAIRAADLFVIAGSSLVVYPAAGLIDYFAGEHLVIINLQPTPRDRHADLCLQARVGEVFDF